MVIKAKQLVKNYVLEHLDKSDEKVNFEVYVVWQCKILKNWKFLISTSLPDGMYYEVTYNGYGEEWYLDAYKKFENQCILDQGEYDMLGRRNKELEKQLEFYRDKVQHLTEELNVANSSIHKYKRLFSQLFDRLQVTGVSRYKVVKDMNNIDDIKTLFCIEYDDGNGYVYKVKLISTSYEEDLNGNAQVDEARKD